MQVQSHYTVATILCRRQHNSIRETLKILCLSSRPVVVFTMADCSINKGCIDLRQDSQVQHYYTITTSNAGQGVLNDTRLCELLTCLFPQQGIAVADSVIAEGGWDSIQYRQIQDRYTIATMDALQDHFLLSTCCIGRIVSCPCEMLTCAQGNNGYGISYRRVILQIQYHYTIATTDYTLILVAYTSWLVINSAIEIICLTGADSSIDNSRWNTIQYGQIQHYQTIATIFTMRQNYRVCRC